MGEMHDMYGAYPDYEPYIRSYNPCDGDYDPPLESLESLLESHRAGEGLSAVDFERIRGGAMKAVSRAVRAGRLEKTNCAECASDQYVEGHHESYLREHWLDVVWLCRDCHNDLHLSRVARSPRRGRRPTRKEIG